MSSEFIKLQKDNVTIEVSPLVVEDHQRIGWTVVIETEAEPAATETSVSLDEKPVRRKSPKNS